MLAMSAMAACTGKKADAQPQKKSIVIYYSQTGATKAVALELQKLLKADIESIEVENPYTGDFQATIGRCQQEMQSNTLPALKPLKSDLSKYDTIYLGYPIWFGTYARPMLAFIKSQTFEGKTIVPFCTFGSGGLNTTNKSLKTDLPKATIVRPRWGRR